MEGVSRTGEIEHGRNQAERTTVSQSQENHHERWSSRRNQARSFRSFWRQLNNGWMLCGHGRHDRG